MIFKILFRVSAELGEDLSAASHSTVEKIRVKCIDLTLTLSDVTSLILFVFSRGL